MYNDTPDNPLRVNPPEEIYMSDAECKHQTEMQDDLLNALMNSSLQEYVDWIDEQIAEDSETIGIMARTTVEGRTGKLARESRDEVVAIMLRGWTTQKTIEFIAFKERFDEEKCLCRELDVLHWSER